MIILIDNYDSFTYNLVHYLGELGADVRVHRNDKITVQAILAEDPQAIVLSPGPCTPDKAGICLDLVREAGAQIPIFGVCLGLQAIAQAYGGKIIRATKLMHGKVSEVTNTNTGTGTGTGLFDGLPKTFSAARYHSLVVAPDSVPDCLETTATSGNGIIMGLSHKKLPVHGVQFHPESIASEQGHALLQNFLTLAAQWRSEQNAAA